MSKIFWDCSDSVIAAANFLIYSFTYFLSFDRFLLGTTSEAMHSVISLADTGSNFEERVVSEEAEESETTDMDVSVIDEKEVLQTAGVSEGNSSDSDEVLLNQVSYF